MKQPQPLHKEYNSNCINCQVDLNTIKQSIQLIFDFDLQEDEFIEIANDMKRTFQLNSAIHIQSVDDDALGKITEKFKNEDGSERFLNLSIATNTRKLKKGGGQAIFLRTGANEILRQNTIILDIDSEKSHKEGKDLSLDEVKELVNYTLYEIRRVNEDIASSVIATAYTGGGGQIWIRLDRVLDNLDDIKKVYEALKFILQDIKTIDVASFNPTQLQRLIGSVNGKYNVLTKFIEIKDNYEPIKVDNLISKYNEYKVKRINIKKEFEEIKQKEKQNIKKHKKEILNLASVIQKIKERARFEDFIDVVEDKGNYFTTLCPFHSENKPSFVVYRNDGFEVAVDFHDNSKYDIISFIMKKETLDFINAVKFLAEKYSIEYKKAEDIRKNNLKEALEKANISLEVLKGMRVVDEGLYYNEEKQILIKQIEGKDNIRTSIHRVSLPPCFESAIAIIEDKEAVYDRNLFRNLANIMGNIIYNDCFVKKIYGNDNVDIEDIFKICGINPEPSVDNIRETIREDKSDFREYVSLCYNPLCDEHCVETCPLKKYKRNIVIKEAVENQGIFEKIKIEIDGEEHTWDGRIIATERQLQRRLKLKDYSLGSIYTTYYIWKQLESKAIKIDSRFQYIDLLVERFWDYMETEDFEEFLMRMEIKIDKNNLDNSYIFFKESEFRRMLNNISERKLEKEDYELFINKINVVKSQNRISGMPTRTIRLPFEVIKANTELFYVKILLHMLKRKDLPEELRRYIEDMIYSKTEEEKEETERQVETEKTKDIEKEEKEVKEEKIESKEEVVEKAVFGEDVMFNTVFDIMSTETQKRLKRYIDDIFKYGNEEDYKDIEIDGRYFKDLKEILLNITDINDELALKLIEYIKNKAPY